MHQIRLRSWQRYLLYTIFFLLWGTGIVYIIEEFLKLEPFLPDTRKSALQLKMLAAHGALAILTAVCAGSLSEHVRQAWPTSVNRRSGVLSILALVVLAASGWALYYVADEFWHSSSSLLHMVVGALFPVLGIVHAYRRRVFRRIGIEVRKGTTAYLWATLLFVAIAIAGVLVR